MSLKLRQVWSPPSLFSLQELAAASEQFDMVFIDADKTNYINYYNFILDNNLLRLRGVMCVDNSLFKAKVYLQETTDEDWHWENLTSLLPVIPVWSRSLLNLEKCFLQKLEFLCEMLNVCLV